MNTRRLSLVAAALMVAATVAATTPSFKAGSAASQDFDHPGTPFQITISSYTVPSLTNGYMIVIINEYAWTSGHDVSSVVWNGTGNLAQISGSPFQYNSANEKLHVWAMKAPTAATGNIVVTYSNGPGQGGVGVVLYENVDQTTPIGAATTNSATGTSVSVGVTPISSGDLAFMATGNDGFVASAPAGSTVERLDTGTGSAVGAYELAYAADPTTPSATITSNPWGAFGFALKQTGGGATATPTRNRIHISEFVRTPTPQQMATTRWKE